MEAGEDPAMKVGEDPTMVPAAGDIEKTKITVTFLLTISCGIGIRLKQESVDSCFFMQDEIRIDLI